MTKKKEVLVPEVITMSPKSTFDQYFDQNGIDPRQVIEYQKENPAIQLKDLKAVEFARYSNRPSAINVIKDFSNILDRHSIKHSFGDVYLCRYGSSGSEGVEPLYERTREHGESSLGSLLVRRTLTLIKFTDFHDAEMEFNLAINNLQNGIQIALGPEVRVCRNLCIYGGNIVSTMNTRGQQGFTYENLKEHITGWVRNLHERYENIIKVIKAMKAYQLTNPDIFPEFFGRLMFEALINQKNGNTSFLNQTEVVSYQRDFINKTKDLTEVDKIKNVWDFYNMGTATLSYAKTDSSRLLSANAEFGNHVVKEFIPELMFEN